MSPDALSVSNSPFAWGCVAPLPVPVVIAGDEQALRAPFPDREDLGSEPALRILPIRVTDRGHATGVDIVTQEHDELADRTERVRLERQS